MAQPVFPQNIKEWTDKQDHIDDVFAGDINGAYAEIIAMQKYMKSVTDTGVANAYSATVPNVTEYFDGLMVTLKIANSNTGSSTLNINDLGAKPIKKEKDVDLAANDIKAGQYVTFVYDGTNFQMVSAVNGLVSHKEDNTPHREAVSIERKNPDDDGIFTLIEFRRPDGTLFKTSQLNGISPYTSRTVKYYDKNGNLVQTVEYSITYSDDGEVISEVITSAE